MAIILWWLYSAVITHYWPSKPTSDTAAHLLGVIGGPGHEGGHVEHDLQPREVCKHTVLSREVSLAVQAAQETLKSLQAHPLPQDIEELIEGSGWCWLAKISSSVVWPCWTRSTPTLW